MDVMGDLIADHFSRQNAGKHVLDTSLVLGGNAPVPEQNLDDTLLEEDLEIGGDTILVQDFIEKLVDNLYM